MRRDIIFIHGAPGTGKSSLAWALQERLKSPCFEFGWIPEFRLKNNSTITYVEEESLAFENLTLVIKNYISHGFCNIIVTDLKDRIVQKLSESFKDYSYILITLWIDNNEVLKERVLNENRSSQFRNWKYSIELNEELVERSLMGSEIRFNSSEKSIEELVSEVIKLL